MTKIKKIICVIDYNQSKKRLDQALTDLIIDLSRTQIKLLIVKGKIKKSNIALTDPSYKVKKGEKFTVLINEKEEELEYLPQNLPLNIVYEDKDIIVLNKDVGVVVHPSPGNQNNTLVNALLYHTKNNLSKINETNRPGIVHRLDKYTSGLLVVAKNNFSHQKLADQFKNHSVQRKYFALAWGVPKKFIIKGYLGRHKIYRKKMAMVTEKQGRYSETKIKIKSHYEVCSLIECELKTGRTHQVRVHLSSIGNPLVGDKVYGRKKIKFNKKCKNNQHKLLILRNFERQALHARMLGFKHPRSNKYMEFNSKLPQDFSILLDNISKY